MNERVAEFRDQTRRFLAGQLHSEDEFKGSSLRNGLYIAAACTDAAHRGSVRTAELSRQLRSSPRSPAVTTAALGHFTTRQNHATQLAEARRRVPDILEHLCLRADARDSRPAATAFAMSPRTTWQALPRTRSTIRVPTSGKSSGSGRLTILEFTYLPRKFKICGHGLSGGPRGVPELMTLDCT